jgi:FMN-dependent oxidoreductase (nitrilotriacetate monooxygenase family)
VLLPAMAVATECLGLAVTMSLSAIPPYTVVRTLSTLDYLTGGRVGWNVVTGHLRGEHRALGLDQLDHDERYDRADEYMDVCHALWNSIQPGAVLADRKSGIFADPSKVGLVNHNGKYFRCNTTAPALPSAQGRPVIFQAGSSGRGQQFAVKHAEVMFAIQPHLDGMQNYMRQLRSAAAAAERKDPLLVTFGIQPYIGGTEAEAKRRHEEVVNKFPIEAALARLSGSLGVDFSTFDLDKPMEEFDTQASRGMMAAMAAMVGSKRLTIRDVARHWGTAVGMMPIIGTPEQIADQMAHIWQETGCAGFNITPTVNNQSIRDFVDQVVPLLQRKGLFRTDYETRTLRGNLTADLAA